MTNKFEDCASGGTSKHLETLPKHFYAHTLDHIFECHFFTQIKLSVQNSPKNGFSSNVKIAYVNLQDFTPDLKIIYTDISAISVTLCNSGHMSHDT